MGKYLFFGIAAILVIVIVILGFTIISWSNEEVALRQQVLAQQKVNTTVFDKTWKVISQQAQVTDRYKDSFRDIYKTIMSERYENSKSVMFNWIKESNPQFESRLFEKLMVSIEALRSEFTQEQKKLIDYSRAHTVMISQFPGSIYAWILGRNVVDITIVTSARTEDAFKTGQENNTQVF